MKRKVLIGIPCLLTGGTEIQTFQLSKALLQQDFEVKVVCYFEFLEDVFVKFADLGIKVDLLRYPRTISSLSFLNKIINYLSRERPDVFHVQYMAPGALPIIAGRLAGIRNIIGTIHYPYTPSHGIKSKIILRTVARCCTYFTTVSLAVQHSWFGSRYLINQTSTTSSRKYLTLYNCIDVSAIQSCQKEANLIRQQLQLENFFVFGYLGRLRQEKGFDVLCAAFKALYRINQNVALLVVGDGPQRVQMENRYKEELFWKNVKFLGARKWEEAVGYFSAMDIVVIPSRFEGFGLSAAEAMAAGKAVIASETGGLLEIVAHEENGLLFEPENNEELKEAMLFFLNNKSQLSSFSKYAKSTAEKFSVDRYHLQILKIYQSLN